MAVEQVTNLGFDINQALKDLNNLETKLAESVARMEKTGSKIGLAGFSDDEMSKLKKITADMNTQVQNSVKLTGTQYKKIAETALKEQSKVAAAGAREEIIQAAKTAGTKERLNAQVEATRLKEHMKIEERIRAEASKTMQTWDFSKIKGVAGTYALYRTFNQLKLAAIDTATALKDVELRMAEINRIVESGQIVVKDYRDAIVNLARDYGREFEETSDITLRFIKAGYDAADAFKMTKDALLALNTAELDAQNATESLIGIMAQWKMTSEDLTGVIDVINKNADRFTLSSQDLVDALKRTSSAGRLAGMSFDEMVAAIVAAETAVQRGGKYIGTSLNSIIAQMKAPGRIDLMESLGLSLFADELQTTFKPANEIFYMLAEAMGKLEAEGKGTSAEMNELLNIFTVFRRNVGAGLLGEMDTFGQSLQISATAAGYSAQENAIYMATLEALTKQLKTTTLELQLALGDEGFYGIMSMAITALMSGEKALTSFIGLVGAFPAFIALATLAISLFTNKLNLIKSPAVLKEWAQNFMQLAQATNKSSILMKGSYDVFLKYNNLVMGFGANSKEVATHVASMTKSQQAYIASLKGAQAGLQGYQAHLTSTTLRTIGLKVATIALNVALNLAIAAIIQVAAKAFASYSESIKEARKETDALIDSSNELIDSWNSSIEAIDKNRIASEAELKLTENMIDRMSELAKKEELNASEMAYMSQGIEKLNAMYPDLGASLDNINGLLLAKSSNLNRSVKATKEAIQEEANYQLALQATQRQLELQNKEQQILGQMSAESAKATVTLYGVIQTEVYQDLEKQLKKVQEALEEAGIDVEKYNNLLGKTSEESEKMGYSVKSQIAGLDLLRSGISDVSAAMQEMDENGKLNVNTALDLIQKDSAYLDLLNITADGIYLNVDATKELALSKIESMRVNIIDQMEKEKEKIKELTFTTYEGAEAFRVFTYMRQGVTTEEATASLQKELDVLEKIKESILNGTAYRSANSRAAKKEREESFKNSEAYWKEKANLALLNAQLERNKTLSEITTSEKERNRLMEDRIKLYKNQQEQLEKYNNAQKADLARAKQGTQEWYKLKEAIAQTSNEYDKATLSIKQLRDEMEKSTFEIKLNYVSAITGTGLLKPEEQIRQIEELLKINDFTIEQEVEVRTKLYQVYETYYTEQEELAKKQKELAKQTMDSEIKAAEAVTAAKKKEINAQLQALRDSWKTQDDDESLRYHKMRTGEEHRQAESDILKQRSREKQEQALEDQITRMEELLEKAIESQDISVFKATLEGDDLALFTKTYADEMQKIDDEMTDTLAIKLQALASAFGTVGAGYEALGLGLKGRVEYDPKVDYSRLIEETKETGDKVALAYLEAQRNAKIDGEELNDKYQKTYEYQYATQSEILRDYELLNLTRKENDDAFILNSNTTIDAFKLAGTTMAEQLIAAGNQVAATIAAAMAQAAAASAASSGGGSKSSGEYESVTKNADGTYSYKTSNATVKTVNPPKKTPSGKFTFDNGGIADGMGYMVKAVNDPEGVLRPEIMRKILAPQRTFQFEKFVLSLDKILEMSAKNQSQVLANTSDRIYNTSSTTNYNKNLGTGLHVGTVNIYDKTDQKNFMQETAREVTRRAGF